MSTAETTTEIDRYREHLRETAAWLMRSIERGRGGSSAGFWPGLGWRHPYPETTGYAVPTLLALERHYDDPEYAEAAVDVGSWLLSIQDDAGSWRSGLHPPADDARPSVFNTGQVVLGLLALHERTGDDQWLDVASRGAAWLSSGTQRDGLWAGGDYRAAVTPTYYSRVAWPMLAVAIETRDDALAASAVVALRTLLDRRLDNGSFTHLGFGDADSAFTHTIAYALRGFLEAAQLLDSWEPFGSGVERALSVLLRRSELNGGRLPGAFDSNWRSSSRFVCLTGNAQIALLLLKWEQRESDLRIVSAAARLIDVVNHSQRLSRVPLGMRGAVAGSSPIGGPYMRFRYPNWAAKFHIDATLALLERLNQEAGVRT